MSKIVSFMQPAALSVAFYIVLTFSRLIAGRRHYNVDWLGHIYSFYSKLYSVLFLE